MRRLAVVALVILLAGCSGPKEGVPADGRLKTLGVPDPVPSESGAEPSSGSDPEPTPGAEVAPRNTTTAPVVEPPVVADDDAVIVAVLDTGIRATHEAFQAGQVVAWYDFGRGGTGVPTVRWDQEILPYDDNGHGTATASMVAGGSPNQTASYAPGAKLAIAKISAPDGTAASADVVRAIEWATDVVGADIISLSFYSYLPSDPGGNNILDALAAARTAGVLPVVLAGNGMNNQGAPTFSWLHWPGTSLDSLVVGGANADGSPVAPEGSMDPEVIAAYTNTVACPASDTCAQAMSGTSFSTPLVAGMAATLLQMSRDNGAALEADELEILLKRVAKDSPAPPSLEGYGLLDSSRFAMAKGHVRDGTQPGSPSLVNEVYVEVVAAEARAAWAGSV